MGKAAIMYIEPVDKKGAPQTLYHITTAAGYRAIKKEQRLFNNGRYLFLAGSKREAKILCDKYRSMKTYAAWSRNAAEKLPIEYKRQPVAFYIIEIPINWLENLYKRENIVFGTEYIEYLTQEVKFKQPPKVTRCSFDILLTERAEILYKNQLAPFIK